MPSDLFDYLRNFGQEERFKKDTELYRIGDTKLPDTMLLIRGEVKACQITLAGDEQIFNVFRKGSVLFLPAATINKTPSLDFIALTDCTVVRIPLNEARELLFHDPMASMLAIQELSWRLTSAHRRLREAEMYSSDWKICNMILDLAEKKGVEYDGKILIREKVSQQFMANMLRISRITVARKLRELRDLGLIESINGYLCIRDEGKLRQHMYYISIPLE